MVQWKTLLFKTAVWLAAECLLGLIGLDDLCDYSEFLECTKHADSYIQQASQPALVITSNSAR